MKQLLQIFLVFFPFVFTCGQGFEFRYEAQTDLNSDGKTDNITVKSIDETFDYILNVNGKDIRGNLGEEPIDGFTVIDINKWDAYREIAVHTPGPSDDDIFMLYWYDGSEIIAMNMLSRWPEFKGNGIVYVKGWEGFWAPLDKYKLDDASRKLIHIEQFAYYVGLKIKINKGFNIFREKELINEVALLSDNSEIEIILCDRKGYDYYDYRYLIKSSTGLLGWSDYRSMEPCITLPSAD